MNKKEFYRELMQNYTVDTEKVKCAAKRRALKKTSSPLKWITCTAACTAAAAVVIVFAVNMLPKPGVDIVDSGLDSAIERVYAAQQRFEELAAKNEVMDMYVSFEKEHTLNEILMSFSAIDNNGDIKLSLLYTTEGKYYRYSDKISSELRFRGAKITAPAKLFEELNRLKIVSLAEPVEGSKYTDKSFVPYVSKEQPAADITIATTPEGTIAEIVITDNTTGSTTSETPQTSETTDITQTETDPEVPATIKIPVADVKTAQFISNDKLIVTTSDSIRLYKLNNSEQVELQLETTFYADDAKIGCTDTQNSLLYITACDTKGRNRLFCADGTAGTLTETDISTITQGESEIASVMCSGNGLIIKTVSTDKANIYYAVRSGSEISITFTKEYTSPVSVISGSAGTICTAMTDSANAAVKICAISTADGTETELASYSAESVRFIRNNTADTAAIVTENEGETRIFLLTPNGTLTEISDSPTFSEVDSAVFKAGEKYYRIENGQPAELEETEASPYFAEPDYPYAYRVSIFEDGTAEIIGLN